MQTKMDREEEKISNKRMAFVFLADDEDNRADERICVSGQPECLNNHIRTETETRQTTIIQYYVSPLLTVIIISMVMVMVPLKIVMMMKMLKIWKIKGCSEKDDNRKRTILMGMMRVILNMMFMMI